MERLQHHLDTLIELVITLVAVLGQNAANVPPAIPSGIHLSIEEGGDMMASEAKIETSQHLRHTRCRCRNVARPTQEDSEPTPKSLQIERTRDSVFNRLERPVANPNFGR